MSNLKDPIGNAILDYSKHGFTENITVQSDLCDNDILPVEYLFRSYDEMPDIEQVALDAASGDILEVGAGSGCHAKYLNKKGLNTFSIDTSEGIMFGGRIIWLRDPLTEEGGVKLDENNPDPKLREQTILGLLIMKDLNYRGEGYWADGSIYDARNGTTYSLEVTMPEKNILKLRGYWGISLIGRTTTWTRVE